MPLKDADFRSLRKVLSPLLRDAIQRQYWLNEAFPTNQRLRNLFPSDALDTDVYTQKLVLHLYEKDPALLAEYLQVMRDEQDGDLGRTLQNYLDKLNTTPDSPPPVIEKQLSAQEYFARGNKRYYKGDNEGAITDYTEAIRLDPEFALAYNIRGNSRADKGDNDGAIADYTEAIHLDPQSAVAYFNRGGTRFNKGDNDGAIADYTEAIHLDPQDIQAYNNRGNARKKKGDQQGADEDFAEAKRVGFNNGPGLG